MFCLIHLLIIILKPTLGTILMGSLAPPHCSLVPPPQRQRGWKCVGKGLKGWNKGSENTHQLPSWAKQDQHREIKVIYCLLLTDKSSEKLEANKQIQSNIIDSLSCSCELISSLIQSEPKHRSVLVINFFLEVASHRLTQSKYKRNRMRVG